MRIQIKSGAAWYMDLVGHEFEVYEISDVGCFDRPELGYTIDPVEKGKWLRYVSEFNCEVAN